MALESVRATAEERRRPLPGDALAEAQAAASPGARASRGFWSHDGMTLVGQGGRILLVTAPALLAAVLAHLRAPGLVRLPIPGAVLTPIGVALMASGLLLWGAAVAQLLVGFPKGRLVTSGAYGVVRNPIYASVGLLVLPGLALVTATWGYLVPAATLCVAVEAFIGAEERDLLRVFGDEYRRYTERVPRLLPFARATAAG